jgi:hypothetical protein
MTKLEIQFAAVARLIASPRTRSGEISAISSQNTGPRPMAKDAP